MKCSTSLYIPKALPSLMTHSQSHHTRTHLCVITCNANITQNIRSCNTKVVEKRVESFNLNKSALGVQVGAILATVVEQPALALTGMSYEEDLNSTLIQSAIVAFFYLIVAPPIIMNWLRLRWYRRKLLETYFQFMFVFIFFPGVLLWAPFLNFRKFPRDPDMKYPWDKPKDPSKIRNRYSKYPYADADDYDYS